LQIDQNYKFTVEEGKNNSKILISYESFNLTNNKKNTNVFDHSRNDYVENLKARVENLKKELEVANDKEKSIVQKKIIVCENLIEA